MRALARSGLTLIEIMVALAIIAVLAAVAVPSMREFMMQQRLKSATAELLGDLQLARSTGLSAARQNSYVNVQFRSNSSLTCYSMTVVPNQSTVCDCRLSSNVCGDDSQYPPFRVVRIERSTGITVPAPVLIFYTSNGMTTTQVARTLAVTATSIGATLNVIVSPTGFPHLCAPTGTNISGVPTCN